MKTEVGSGGAGAFLEFLTTTLWPELAKRYAVREDARGLAGHSLGSLLAVYALFQKPTPTSPGPFFDRILASAPSLWWDDRSILGIARDVRRSGAAVPAHLFLCVGEEDTPSMTGDLALFEQQLAAKPFPELRVTSRRFPGHNHYDVLETAFAAGLGALYGLV
jgi:predicted alpha/beta superfamily hydrolase